MASYTYRSSTYEYYRHLRREVGKMAEEKIGDQTVVQQASGAEELIVSTFFRSVSARELFGYWTRARLVKQWWAEEAEIDSRPEGAYHLSWPTRGWDLRGVYTVYEPGKTLAFTWLWEGEGDMDSRTVKIRFETVGDIGTQLTLTQGEYADTPEEQEMRQGQLDSWTYLLARLHSALA